MTKRFATTDADGRVIGFYASDIGAVPPDDAMEITEEVYLEWCRNCMTRRWNGAELVECEPVVIDMPVASKAELTAQVQELLAKISALPDD